MLIVSSIVVIILDGLVILPAVTVVTWCVGFVIVVVKDGFQGAKAIAEGKSLACRTPASQGVHSFDDLVGHGKGCPMITVENTASVQAKEEVTALFVACGAHR